MPTVRAVLCTLRDAVLTGFLLLLGWGAAGCSPRLRRAAGRPLGRLWWWGSPLRRRTTLENLRRAFPELSAVQRLQLARACYDNAGTVVLEIAAMGWMSEQALRTAVRFENPELFAQCVAKGRGLLLLSAHYGNWEWLACAAGLYLRSLGVPVTVVVKRQHNPFVDTLLNRYRQRWGNRTVPLERAPWAIARAVRSGEAVAMLADQRAAPEHALWLPFLGHPAATHTAFARLALRFRMPVILGFARREPNGSYSVRLEELPVEELPDSPEGVRQLAAYYLKRLESAIAQAPELWLWQHRRWRDSPPPAYAPDATAPAA